MKKRNTLIFEQTLKFRKRGKLIYFRQNKKTRTKGPLRWVSVSITRNLEWRFVSPWPPWVTGGARHARPMTFSWPEVPVSAPLQHPRGPPTFPLCRLGPSLSEQWREMTVSNTRSASPVCRCTYKRGTSPPRPR